MAFKPEDIPGLIQSVLTMVKGDLRELPKKYKELWGESLDKSLEVLDIYGNNLNALADYSPDLFCIRNGMLSTRIDDDQADIISHMNRSNAPKSKGRSRGGGFRGGRAGGNVARGGFGGGSYGAAFRSDAPRGGGGGGGSRGQYRGGGRGGSSSQSFGSGGGGRGGGGGFDSGFGSRANDSFGAEPRRRYDSPPRDSYSNRDSYSRNEPPRSDNRGFASNYDDFAESTKRGGYDDDRRYNDSYRTDGRGYDYDYDDNYDDEPTVRAKSHDDRDDRYRGESFKVTVRNDPVDYDRTVDYADDRRGGSGYRRQQSEYSDEDDYGRSRRRDERDDYGRDGRGFGRGAQDSDRYGSNSHHHSLHDDRTQRDYGNQREEELPARKTAFPSAFGSIGPSASASSTRPATGGSVFAPLPYSEDDRDDRLTPPSFGRSGRNEPEDPVQQPGSGFGRAPCQPFDPYATLPPGLEQSVRSGPPPGLNYPVGPPPGLPSLPPIDPAKKTPTQREQEVNPNEVSMDELGHLIFSAIEKDGGYDVPKDKIIGLILKHCNRDVFPVIHARGGITHVLDTVCHRGRDRLEFETDDNGQDYVALRQPYKQAAIERYGGGKQKVYLPDEVEDDDDDDAESYLSARSTAKPMPTSSRAPVRSEVDLANELWKIVRTQGQYRNASGEYELRLTLLLKHKEKIFGSELNLFKFLSRPEFESYFRVKMQEGPDGDLEKYVFAIGAESPLKGIMGIEPAEDNSVQRSRQVTPPSSSGRGSATRSGDPSRPYAFKFYHKRDDPEMGYESHRSYKRKEEVYLTFFHSFYEFYVMTERDFEETPKFSDKLYDDHCMLPFKDTQYWAIGHAGVYIQPKERKAYRFNVVRIDQELQEMTIRRVDVGDKMSIDVRDAVAMKEEYKKEYAKCFRCSLEDYEPLEEDDLWALHATMRKYKDLLVKIEPVEKILDDNTLIVNLTFTPPDRNNSMEKRYPDDLYSKRLTRPDPRPKQMRY